MEHNEIFTIDLPQYTISFWLLMEPEQPNREKDNWARTFYVLAQLLVPIAVLLLGIFLTEDRSPWLIAGLAVAVSALTSTVVSVLVSQRFARRTEVVVRGIEGAVTEQVVETFAAVTQQLADIAHAARIREESRDGITQERLSEHESRLDVKTIWIVGESFDTEVAPDSPFLDVVRINICNRAVKYVYIAPKSARLGQSFQRLRAALKLADDDQRLISLHLDEEQWRKLPYPAGNFVIYDPTRAGRVPEGYCWDPGGDGKSFIRLRQSVTLEWVGLIREACPELNDDYDDHVPDATSALV